VCVAHCRYPIYLTRGETKCFPIQNGRLPLSSSPQQIQDILPVKPPPGTSVRFEQSKTPLCRPTEQTLSFQNPANHSAFQNQPITLLSEPSQSLCFSEPTNHSAFHNQPITLLFRTNQSLCFSEPTNHSAFQNQPTNHSAPRQNKHNVWSNGSTPLSGQIKKNALSGTESNIHF
jgi:hypothetical protein